MTYIRSIDVVLAVAGSRGFNDYDLLTKSINEISSRKQEVIEIVSGGAKGADKLAERYAKENNILTTIYLPDWKKHGKAAGIIRNKDIIDRASHVIAFWDGVSPGTKNSIERATRAGKVLIVVQYTNKM